MTLAGVRFPFRLADQFYKAARGGSPEEWRRLGTLLDRNFDEIAIPDTTVFHMRGALIADTSDPYPVMRGGKPSLQAASGTPPTGAELDVLRNGVVIETIPLVFNADGYMAHQVEAVWARGDLYVLDLTDPGTGGDGLVVTTDFVRR